MTNNNFANWPYFAPDEVDAVREVLQSGKVNYWTGEHGRQFEKEFAEYIGCQHAVALTNGTHALELALYSLDIGAGDEVIVPCRTFIATASAVVARGAIPVPADVDCYSQNISLETIKQVVTNKTKAIIVVHLAGWPCDMDSIVAFGKERNIKIIEDCAQAHGAVYKGCLVGSFGDVAAFSFCQDKIMTTGGEGGMLLTNDSSVWEKARSYKDHGKNFKAINSKQNNFMFNFVHDAFGTNFRMTEMQAVIGRLQLKKLPGWLVKRRQFAAIYNECFKGLSGVGITIPESEYVHAYYKYYLFIKPERLRSDWSRDRIIKEAQQRGVLCYSGICPEIYLEKAFSETKYSIDLRFESAKKLGETSLMLLLHPTLSECDIRAVGEVVGALIKEATLD